MEPIHLYEKAEFSKENFVPKQIHIGDAGAAVLICFEPGQAMPLWRGGGGGADHRR